MVPLKYAGTAVVCTRASQETYHKNSGDINGRLDTEYTIHSSSGSSSSSSSSNSSTIVYRPPRKSLTRINLLPGSTYI